MTMLTTQRWIVNAPEGIWYWTQEEEWIPENSRTSEILFQHGHLGIQGSVHALDKITVSKYQAEYEELEMHGYPVIKITM